MPLSPAAIGIILINNNSEVLLVKRQDVPYWVLPGGGIEDGETPEDAVVREVFEETKLHISVLKTTAIYTPINFLSAKTFLFKCKIDSGIPSATDECSDVAFFSLDQLPSTLFFIHKKWLFENLNSSQLIKRPLNEISFFALFLYFIKHPWTVLRFAWTRLFKDS